MKRTSFRRLFLCALTVLCVQLPMYSLKAASSWSAVIDCKAKHLRLACLGEDTAGIGTGGKDAPAAWQTCGPLLGTLMETASSGSLVQKIEATGQLERLFAAFPEAAQALQAEAHRGDLRPATLLVVMTALVRSVTDKPSEEIQALIVTHLTTAGGDPEKLLTILRSLSNLQGVQLILWDAVAGVAKQAADRAVVAMAHRCLAGWAHALTGDDGRRLTEFTTRIFAALEEETEPTRLIVPIGLLGLMPWAQPADALLAHVNAAWPEVRAAALTSLAAVAADRALTSLRSAAQQDPSPLVRGAAITALAERPLRPELLAFYREVLAQEGAVSVVQALLTALGKGIKDCQEAHQILQTFLTECGNSDLRAVARGILESTQETIENQARDAAQAGKDEL